MVLVSTRVIHNVTNQGTKACPYFKSADERMNAEKQLLERSHDLYLSLLFRTSIEKHLMLTLGNSRLFCYVPRARDVFPRETGWAPEYSSYTYIPYFLIIRLSYFYSRAFLHLVSSTIADLTVTFVQDTPSLFFDPIGRVQ